MTWSEERKNAYYLAKQILRVQKGDLLAHGQSIIRVDRLEVKSKLIPMRTFYVKPLKKNMNHVENMAALRKFIKRRKPR